MNLPLTAMDTRLAALPLFPAQVVSAHRRVINLASLADAACLFSLTDERVPVAPRQLRCAQLPVLDADTVQATWAADVPRFDCTLRLPAKVLQTQAVQTGWQMLMQASAPPADVFAATVQKYLQQGIAALLQALDSETETLPVAPLLGLGLGLTPSGDDFLCGLIIALHLPQSPYARQLPRLRAQVLAALGATHAISAAFLRDAACAQVSAPVQAVVDALHGGDGLDAALVALTQLGHRSGFDILSGLLAGLPHSPDRRVYLCPCIAN